VFAARYGLNFLSSLTCEGCAFDLISLGEICGGRRGSGGGGGTFSLSVLWFSPVAIIPPILHTHPYLRVVLPEGRSGEGSKRPNKRHCF
jgi:hypothetical protein